MTTMNEVTTLVDELNSELKTVELVAACLEHNSALVRANAIRAISTLSELSDSDKTTMLAASINDDKNQVELLGGVDLQMTVAGELVRLGTTTGRSLVENWLAKRNRNDIEIFQRYLDSEGIRQPVN